MKTRCLLTLLAFTAVTGHARRAAVAAAPDPGRAGHSVCGPARRRGALGTDETDVPAVTVYLPRTVGANTPAVVICPGGSYRRAWRRIMKDGRSPAT